MCGRFALGQQHIDFLEALDAQYPRIFRRQPGGRAPQRLRGGGPEDQSDAKPDVKPEEAETKPSGVESQEDAKPGEEETPKGEEKPQTADLETSNAAGDESNAPNDQSAAKAEDTKDIKLKGENQRPSATDHQNTKDSEELKWHAAPALGFKWKREQDFWPSYNIAPRQRSPVIRRDSKGEAMLETMQWGLIPHWTKHPPTGPLNTINARSEAVIDPSSGGLWHALKKWKRCVVPAQGYYEWQKKGSTKVAHFARLPLLKSPDTPSGESEHGDKADDPPIVMFAGFWDEVEYEEPVPSKWKPEPGDPREPYPTGNPVPLATFTILTTVPAPDIAWLHDRMPCVLRNEEDIARWLDLGETPEGWVDGKGGTADVLQSEQGLDVYPVLPEVGKIGQSKHAYILPVAERRDGIKSFFAKQSSPVKPKAEPKATSVKAEPVTPTKPKPASQEPKPKPQESKPELQETGPASQDVTEVLDSDDEPGTKRKAERQGGRRTKVVRPTPPEKKDQKSITSFFKSPKK